MILTWKRISDNEYYIEDGFGGRVLGPLASEQFADNALSLLLSCVSDGVSRYKEDFPEKFAANFLKAKAVARVVDIFARISSVYVSVEDAEKFVDLLARDHVSALDIIDGDEQDLWMSIKLVCKSLPSHNPSDILRK